MTTIAIDQNTAAILQTLKAQAEAQGATLDDLLESLIEREDKSVHGQEQPQANEGMLAVLAYCREQLKSMPFSGSTEDSLKILDNGIGQGEPDDENVEGVDVFSLRHMPPEDSFVVQMRFVDAGEGEPARYDFSGIFDDNEER